MADAAQVQAASEALAAAKAAEDAALTEFQAATLAYDRAQAVFLDAKRQRTDATRALVAAAEAP